ncbi:MAG: HupE/UreJ family protein [Kofleriaceae bacterium]
MRTLVIATIAMIATIAVTSTHVAEAHQSSLKYVDVTIDGHQALLAVTVAPGDVTEPLGLPDTDRPSVTDAAVPVVASWVAGWITATGCTPGPASARPDQAFVVVAWTVTCPSEIERLELDFSRFFALDRRHDASVTAHAPGETTDPTIVRAGEPIIVMSAGESSIAGWIGYGMDHIYGGPDHVCFVLALLLVVVLVRRPQGFVVRRPVEAVRATAAIITAFTIAHSLSLITASLGWIALPTRVVESLIAASIIYTAIENVVRPDARWRFGLTFAFGLVHGLGFASQLEERLPANHVIVPLLAFNVGVELGQLTIVAVALPVCWFLARGLGAVRYRHIVIRGMAVLLSFVGIKWLIERVFSIETVSVLGM